jgi:hypothetical protein
VKSARFIGWLRGMHRSYKFAILLIAAWAPFLFPNHPLVTWGVMVLATTLFFIATARGRGITKTIPLAVRENDDVER